MAAKSERASAGHRPAPVHTHPDDVPLLTALSALADPVRIQLIRDLAGHPDWTLSCSNFDVPIGRAAKSHHFSVLRDSRPGRTARSGPQTPQPAAPGGVRRPLPRPPRPRSPRRLRHLSRESGRRDRPPPSHVEFRPPSPGQRRGRPSRRRPGPVHGHGRRRASWCTVRRPAGRPARSSAATTRARPAARRRESARPGSTSGPPRPSPPHQTARTSPGPRGAAASAPRRTATVAPRRARHDRPTAVPSRSRRGPAIRGEVIAPAGKVTPLRYRYPAPHTPNRSWTELPNPVAPDAAAAVGRPGSADSDSGVPPVGHRRSSAAPLGPIAVGSIWINADEAPVDSSQRHASPPSGPHGTAYHFGPSLL